MIEEATDQNRTFHALLIGIDKYLPNELSDGSYFRDLSGCVRDIQHVEQFLRAILQVPAENIIKLTASNNGTDEPPEQRECWPTYENMVGAFERLAQKAKAGDQIYIHYSGHGARAFTIVPEIKLQNGLDECLVPTDIGNSEARYLRDIELVKLLRSMVKRKLVVTVVLDSCHSAGMSRGRDATIRGHGIDTTLRSTRSLVGTREELAAAWVEATKHRTRSLTGTPWLPGFEGLVLLSACGPSEYAYEYPFNGTESNGALTYWFLNSLGELGLNLTYRQLHDRLVAKVHSQFESQTPHLEGDGSRLVFGIDRVPSLYSALVMEVDSAGKLLLNAGQAHGIRRGSEFAVYSLRASDLNNSCQPLGVATVQKVGATDSWADFTTSNGNRVEQGDQARLINPGSIQLVRRVSLLDDVSKREKRGAILNLITEAIEKSPWLELADSKRIAHYQVAVNSENEVEILDRGGTNLTAEEFSITVNTKDAARLVVQRLEHFTKYHAVQEIDNHDTRSPLARKLLVEWAGYQKDFEPGDKPEPIPFQATANVPTVEEGEWVFLKLSNLSENVLNVTVLNLEPDRAINQVHPVPPTNFVALDPNTEEFVPLKAGLPNGRSQAREILKVFATIGTANFRWLQLPPLDKQGSNKTVRSTAPGSLDALLDALTNPTQLSRQLSPAAYPSQEWTTAQIEIQIVKRN